MLSGNVAKNQILLTKARALTGITITQLQELFRAEAVTDYNEIQGFIRFAHYKMKYQSAEDISKFLSLVVDAQERTNKLDEILAKEENKALLGVAPDVTPVQQLMPHYVDTFTQRALINLYVERNFQAIDIEVFAKLYNLCPEQEKIWIVSKWLLSMLNKVPQADRYTAIKDRFSKNDMFSDTMDDIRKLLSADQQELFDVEFRDKKPEVKFQSIQKIVAHVESIANKNFRSIELSSIFQKNEYKALLKTAPDITPVKLIIALYADHELIDKMSLLVDFINLNMGAINLSTFTELYQLCPEIYKNIFLENHLEKILAETPEDQRYDGITKLFDASQFARFQNFPIAGKIRNLLTPDHRLQFDAVYYAKNQQFEIKRNVAVDLQLLQKRYDTEKSQLLARLKSSIVLLQVAMPLVSEEGTRANRFALLVTALKSVDETISAINTELEMVSNNEYAYYPHVLTDKLSNDLNVLPNFKNQESKQKYVKVLTDCANAVTEFNKKFPQFVMLQDARNYKTSIPQENLEFLNASLQTLQIYCLSLSEASTTSLKTVIDELITKSNTLKSDMDYHQFRLVANDMLALFKNNERLFATPRDNSWSHIVANVALALTGIGFIAQLVNVVTTGKLFFFFSGTTTRQVMANEVKASISRLQHKNSG